MASRNLVNVKAATVKRNPGGNVTGVTNFERPEQRSRRGGRAEGDYAAGLQGAAAPQRQVAPRAARHATGPPIADVRFAPAGSTGHCNTARSLSAGVSKPKVF